MSHGLKLSGGPDRAHLLGLGGCLGLGLCGLGLGSRLGLGSLHSQHKAVHAFSPDDPGLEMKEQAAALTHSPMPMQSSWGIKHKQQITCMLGKRDR